MSNAYCTGRHPEGWLCVLSSGHTYPHLSFDNKQFWKGSVGAPVRWEARVKPSVPVKRPGYTGIPCDNCGSPNTVRIGKCLRCEDCLEAGECG